MAFCGHESCETIALRHLSLSWTVKPQKKPFRPPSLLQPYGGNKMRSRFLAFKLLLGMAVAMFGMLSLPVGAHAQLTRGAITGTVRDEAGASIPDALVRVINPQTNVARETTSNNEGFYRMGAIEPGTYTVTVEKSGFTK